MPRFINLLLLSHWKPWIEIINWLHYSKQNENFVFFIMLQTHANFNKSTRSSPKRVHTKFSIRDINQWSLQKIACTPNALLVMLLIGHLKIDRLSYTSPVGKSLHKPYICMWCTMEVSELTMHKSDFKNYSSFKNMYRHTHTYTLAHAKPHVHTITHWKSPTHRKYSLFLNFNFNTTLRITTAFSQSIL